MIYANNAAVHLVGYSSQEELLAAAPGEIMNRFELFDEHNKEISPASLPGRYALMGQESAEMVVGWRIRATGEKHWSIVKASPVKNEEGQVLLAVSIFRDITERVQRERSKDDFIALASHELKTPVTSLKITTQVLKRRIERAMQRVDNGDRDKGSDEVMDSAEALSADQVRDTLKQLARMDEQLDKLVELVRDLLDVSKIGAGTLSYHLEHFDVAELVQETVDEMQLISDKHTIDVVLPGSKVVSADRERIRQVLTNLISNAIKYSPDADRIVVGIHPDMGDTEQEVTICVQDFGIGIPRSEQSRVFNRFFQVNMPDEAVARDTFPGLGLGLFISSEIVKRHGGEIWVESNVGEGSTFYFTLPVQ